MPHPSLSRRRRKDKVQFLSLREEQEEEFGTMVRRWRPAMTVMAEVQDILPSRAERVAEAIDLTRSPCRIRMLYRAGVEPTMRVRIGERTLRIISGPARIGRRQEGLEILAEDHSTEGEEP